MTQQKTPQELNKWMIEVESILAKNNVHGLISDKELRKCWTTLYNQKYTPMQAYNHVILGILD